MRKAGQQPNACQRGHRISSIKHQTYKAENLRFKPFWGGNIRRLEEG